MSDKKLIIRRIILLIVIMFVLDQGIGAVLRHFFYAKRNGFDYRENVVINKTHADVLVFGSSRATYHYDTRLLQDSLHLSFYNAGRDLSYILYHYALLKCVLERYSPKLVILDTRPNEFETFKYGENYDRLNVLLPFYFDHPEIREICHLRSRFERVKLLSAMYPYNSLILPELIELLPIAKYKKDDSDNGYIGKSGEWVGPKPEYGVEDNIDSVSVIYYRKFIQTCKEKHIKLMIAYSPLYQRIDSQHNRMVALVKQICKENNLPLINYLDNKEFDNPHYFFDGLHLNHTGADLYSTRIVPQIRQVLNEK